MKKDMMSEYFDKLTGEQKKDFMAIHDLLCQLGYKPAKANTQELNIVFKNGQTREHIAKFSIENDRPVLKIKFYSSKNYSGLFAEAIRKTIEEYDYKYTGCYRCGKCHNRRRGYDYTYPDGRHYFRCGKELIAIYDFQHHDLEEIQYLINKHHQYLVSMISQ